MLIDTTHPAARSTTGPATVAVELALQGAWRQQVVFDASERTYRRLASTDDWEAWLLGWWPGQRTGVHDHGGAGGAIVVVRGALLERFWPAADQSRQPTEQELVPGRVRSFGGHLVHDVLNVGDEPAVSIHVYSPRLTRMGRFLDDLTPAGVDRQGVDW